MRDTVRGAWPWLQLLLSVLNNQTISLYTYRTSKYKVLQTGPVVQESRIRINWNSVRFVFTCYLSDYVSGGPSDCL